MKGAGKTKGTGIALSLLALVALSGASWFFLFAPKLREIRRLQADVAAADAEMGTALRAWEEMAHTSRSDIDRLERTVIEWRDKVPDLPETERLLDELGRQAVRHKGRAFRLSAPEESGGRKDGSAVSGPGGGEGAAGEEGKGTQGEEGKGTQGEIRLRLSFRSSYREMAGFLDDIPRMKRLVSVRTVSIREAEGDMETTLDLAAFYRRRR